MANQPPSRPIVSKLPRTRLSKYRAWVRTLPCPCGCGTVVECQHLKHTLNMSGTALKAPDILCHPACHELHMKIHAEPDNYKQQQTLWIFTTLTIAISVGVLVINDETIDGPF